MLELCDIFRPKKIEFLAFEGNVRSWRDVFEDRAERIRSVTGHSEAI